MSGRSTRRRVRRLLPASLVCLAGVIVAARLHQFDGVTELRRDLWAAFAQLYNWVAARQQRRLRRGDRQGGRAAGAARPLLVAGDRGAVLLGVAARPASSCSVPMGCGDSASSLRLWAAFVAADRGDRRDGGRRRRRRTSPPRPGCSRSSPAPSSPSWFATVRSCRVRGLGSRSLARRDPRVCDVVAGRRRPGEGRLATCLRRRVRGLDRRAATTVARPHRCCPSPRSCGSDGSATACISSTGRSTRSSTSVASTWIRTVLFAVRLAITLVVATASFYLVELPVRAGRVRWRPVTAAAAGASARRRWDRRRRA